ncbi:hypothetical protein R9X47_27135 [Wukongibacter baidiensis]|uniref:hypothetical protein n=1 Tax=Wukongibacter baidiensis TaxID=1723361 RepID=UPI003D7FF80B
MKKFLILLTVILVFTSNMLFVLANEDEVIITNSSYFQPIPENVKNYDYYSIGYCNGTYKIVFSDAPIEYKKGKYLIGDGKYYAWDKDSLKWDTKEWGFSSWGSESSGYPVTMIASNHDILYTDGSGIFYSKNGIQGDGLKLELGGVLVLENPTSKSVEIIGKPYVYNTASYSGMMYVQVENYGYGGTTTTTDMLSSDPNAPDFLRTHKFSLSPYGKKVLKIYNTAKVSDYVEYSIPDGVTVKYTPPTRYVSVGSQIGFDLRGRSEGIRVEFGSLVELIYYRENDEGKKYIVMNSDYMDLLPGYLYTIRLNEFSGDPQKTSIKYSDIDMITEGLETVPVLPQQEPSGDVIDNSDSHNYESTPLLPDSLLGIWSYEKTKVDILDDAYKFQIPFTKESMWDDKDDIELKVILDGNAISADYKNNVLDIWSDKGLNGASLYEWQAIICVNMTKSPYFKNGKHTVQVYAKWKNEVRLSKTLYIGYTQEEIDEIPDDEKPDDGIIVDDEFINDPIGIIPPSTNDGNEGGGINIGNIKLPTVELTGDAGYVGNTLKNSWSSAIGLMNPTMSEWFGADWLIYLIGLIILFTLIRMA